MAVYLILTISFSPPSKHPPALLLPTIPVKINCSFSNSTVNHQIPLQLNTSDFLYGICGNHSPKLEPAFVGCPEDKLYQAIIMNGAKIATCAVIGSSGILLHCSYGEEIDNHSLIIRINYAPIAEWTKEVGSRTDLRFVYSKQKVKNPNLTYVHPKTGEVHTISLLNVENNPNVFFFEALGRVIIRQKRNLKSRFYSYSQKMFKHFQKCSKKHINAVEGTGGLKTILLSLTFCEKIDIYGFYPYEKPPGINISVPYKYYNPQDMTIIGGRHVDRMKQHNFSEEYKFLKNLSNLENSPLRLVEDWSKCSFSKEKH